MAEIRLKAHDGGMNFVISFIQYAHQELFQVWAALFEQHNAQFASLGDVVERPLYCSQVVIGFMWGTI